MHATIDENAQRFKISSKKLGSGKFSTVYKAKDKVRGTKLAVKILHPDPGDDSTKSLQHEVTTNLALRHQNITQIVSTYWSDGRIHIVMERAAHGDLFDWVMMQREAVPDYVDFMSVVTNPTYASQATSVCSQIAAALTYAHGEGVAHRDIKPENTLVCSLDPIHVKITDWGLAFRRDMDSDEERVQRCGSPVYASPEMLHPYMYANNAEECESSASSASEDATATTAWYDIDPFVSDVWSFSVACHLVAYMDLPLDPKELSVSGTSPFVGYERLLTELDPRIDPRLFDMLSRSLVPEPNKRISMRDCHDILCKRVQSSLSTRTLSSITTADDGSVEGSSASDTSDSGSGAVSCTASRFVVEKAESD